MVYSLWHRIELQICITNVTPMFILISFTFMQVIAEKKNMKRERGNYIVTTKTC